MKKEGNKVLILGIGNVGRQDDALGWMFLEYLDTEHFSSVDIEYRYQLQVEDAELIGSYDRILFIDACKTEIDRGFFMKPCVSSDKHSFSTHSLLPETVMHLAGSLYENIPDAFVMGIQGYEWELEMGVSDMAYQNYLNALNFFIENYDDFIDIKKEFTNHVLI
ncbi:MAG: hydrogenase maturation protease [Bacteroidia bacterium]|nr:hydrogenase maturation protease [Bacteroidia bacterium]MBT8270074.1 hydrogenase maturation protease [Bacteroidia bacterium]NNF81395.1 hydrogenase maturation protease [Flavobacteriaceae bacterium]NNK70699.1 hydrogenase maturation protease [Flavobacteriaceae bacterium]NNL81622.1 hydrogenase maturation protease [Flavobacteriaceae bacterium]